MQLSNSAEVNRKPGACVCVQADRERNTRTSTAMEDDGAVSSPESLGVHDAEATPAVNAEELAAGDKDDDNDNGNDNTADGDDEERASRRRRAREGQEEEEKEVMQNDLPYEYPTGLVEVDDQ